MTGYRDILTDFKEKGHRQVTVANSKSITVEGPGVIICNVQDGSVNNTLKARNVLCVPGITDNLTPWRNSLRVE